MKAVFIGGCDRSGTTFLASLLGSSKKVCVTPESQFFVECQNEHDYLEAYKNHMRFKIWDVQKKHLDGLKTTNVQSEDMIQLVRAYEASRQESDAEIWLDHTPSNIKNPIFLKNNFVDSKFIHIVRDGRGVASSFTKLNWGPVNIYSSASWWVESICFGLVAERVLGKEFCLRVRYEDVLNNPRIELTKICNFIGVNFEEEMLSSNGFNIPKYTSRQHLLVNEQVDKRKIFDWENILTQRDIELFENRTNELLLFFGYKLKYSGITTPLTRKERVVYIISFLKYFRNYLSQKLRQWNL